MPIADDPHSRPADEPEPAAPDPFDGLVLDERFVRGATVKEPTARTRMLSARWRLEPPVDPGGRRWSPEPSAPGVSGKARRRGWSVALVVLAVVASVAAIATGPGDGLVSTVGSAAHGLFSGGSGSSRPAPAGDVALAGGGVSDGSKCGVKGFHHFASPAVSAASAVSAVADVKRDAPSPGPQLALGSYGFAKSSAQDPGQFTIDLLLAPGGSQPMDLSPPLGPQGVAVEIEGPSGLVGGAYNLPVTLDDTAMRTAEGKIRIGPENGGSARVTLPVQALCPGIDGLTVQQRLVPPTDSTNTITGQPVYTLTVSISDPAIGALRHAVSSSTTGDVLSANNLVPR